MTSLEYEQRLENLTVKLKQTQTQIQEVTSAMTTLNKTYNTAIDNPIVSGALSAKDEEAKLEEMLQAHEVYQAKLQEIDDEIETKSNVNQLKNR